MTGLVEKIVAVHNSLESAGLPHAFGGALALAWCTEQARGTIDIDVNVLVDAAQSELSLILYPKKRYGQGRTWSDYSRKGKKGSGGTGRHWISFSIQRHIMNTSGNGFTGNILQTISYPFCLAWTWLCSRLSSTVLKTGQILKPCRRPGRLIPWQLAKF